MQKSLFTVCEGADSEEDLKHVLSNIIYFAALNLNNFQTSETMRFTNRRPL